ncbi:glycosyltransferase family 4 protein [Flavobacterium sp. xlx-214]|uniref:glycosyltransferase n=1 Tax=unclassified Flavobacterium TaxID=196869 RepID=UPI0013D10104|nr:MULTISPECIES: glycosyltransferase [unclassified Flavobacterium]MBA5791192.1 glycosyltransferase family 4 protein [Flavobacterium sp. xlx-221]QMI83638.1 glycosyltransferase family 4 protein [Flavobacterium sp. xlx-214]
MPKKILFVLHEDSQSGAPKALLSFLTFLKLKYPTEFIIDVFVLHSIGGIEKELKSVANNFYKKTRKKTFFGKMFKSANYDTLKLQLLNKYDLIYGNTIVTLKEISKIKKKYNNVKTIMYVHESQYLCSLYLEKEEATEQFKYVDKILSVAHFSANNLIKKYGVSNEKISIIRPTINKETPESNNPIKANYTNYDLILANIGHPNLTKGTDLIPQIANILRVRNPHLKFKILVVGVLNNNEYLKAIKLDIDKLNLDDYIELIPHTPVPQNYMDISNGYLIMSREDSFTLMGIQAALFNKPIVTFNKNTGLTEVLDETCTFQADYLNIQQFVEQIELIYKNPDLVQQKTLLAKQKCDELLDFEKSNQKHFEIISNFIKS